MNDKVQNANIKPSSNIKIQYQTNVTLNSFRGLAFRDAEINSA